MTIPHASREPRPDAPITVCLCGSMRFLDVMLAASVGESLAGRIVVLPLVNMKQPDSRWATAEARDRIKTALDTLHLAKIDRADEVLIINPGRYIGESTRREIAYAHRQGKPVRYLEPADDVPAGSGPAGA
ncbi:hypothetical protein AB0L41_31725 [Amycolatopsis mediterranei]|uniref:hypothetical protein n=1 Tax=Amycolatopsis mediterranei TaxID=33910 RepID=UPI0034372C5E